MKIIYKGDDTNAFGQRFLTIYLKNPKKLKISKAEFRSGMVFKSFVNPIFPLPVDLSKEETEKLDYKNEGYLAVYDEKGLKSTLNAKISFTARKRVV